MPRLILLRRSNVEYDRIYVHNVKYSWQLESLKQILLYLQIPQDKMLFVDGDSVIQATTLIVPSVPLILLKSLCLPDWLVKELRTIFLNSDYFCDIKYDKIYVSRSKVQIRGLTNEDQLIIWLQKLGFATVHLEDLEPLQQAYLFHGAKVIIGVHGSGFANLIFTTPGCKIIEIDHRLDGIYQRSLFNWLANSMNCQYCPFYADSILEEFLDTDITLQIEDFISYVQTVL